MCLHISNTLLMSCYRCTLRMPITRWHNIKISINSLTDVLVKKDLYLEAVAWYTHGCSCQNGLWSVSDNTLAYLFSTLHKYMTKVNLECYPRPLIKARQPLNKHWRTETAILQHIKRGLKQRDCGPCSTDKYREHISSVCPQWPYCLVILLVKREKRGGEEERETRIRESSPQCPEFPQGWSAACLKLGSHVYLVRFIWLTISNSSSLVS